MLPTIAVLYKVLLGMKKGINVFNKNTNEETLWQGIRNTYTEIDGRWIADWIKKWINKS